MKSRTENEKKGGDTGHSRKTRRRGHLEGLRQKVVKKPLHNLFRIGKGRERRKEMAHGKRGKFTTGDLDKQKRPS